MKTLLMVAALLAGLAGPALADEAATPPPPQTQAALAPSQEGTAPAPLPHSVPASAVPMPAAISVPLESNAAPPPMGGGCHHANKTVYLTN